MPLSTISPHHPLTSYARVQTWIGSAIRSRRFQLRHPRVQNSAYLDTGCGLNTHAEFINRDYLWHPGVDVCWDISRGLPFADASLRGVFTEPCPGHFPLPAARELLREIRRGLAPGGTAPSLISSCWNCCSGNAGLIRLSVASSARGRIPSSWSTSPPGEANRSTWRRHADPPSQDDP